jgi:Mn-dependent DtxR family transcriptional regulator
MSSNAKFVYTLLIDDEGLSKKEIAELLNLSWPQMTKALNELKERRLLTETGGNS